MIYLYSGTPGSGKSYHVAKKMIFQLRQGTGVISTVEIDLNVVTDNGKKKIGKFTYKPIMEISPEFLYNYAFTNHVKGKEGQTLVIIDECQIIFNPREFGGEHKQRRMEWINFFTQHRHLGYNFILISQFDRLIDRQIRALFEYEIKHRKANNRGLLFLLPITCFVAIEMWYGVKEKLGSEFIIFNKKYAKLYDSYIMFDKFLAENAISTEETAAELAASDDNILPEAPHHILGGGVRGSLPERFWCGA